MSVKIIILGVIITPKETSVKNGILLSIFTTKILKAK